MKVIDAKILVKVRKPEHSTASVNTASTGFIVPAEKGLDYEVADVLSVGSKITDVKVDDVVYLRKGSGTKFIKDDEEYLVISIPDILAVED